MLAINHATLATAVVFGISVYLERPFFLPLIIFVVFAGVFPDIDHPGSELGRYFKPIGKLLPHRGITHSILGTAIFVVGLYFLLGYDKIFTYILIVASFFGVYLLEKILEKHISRIDDITFKLVSEKQATFLLRFVTMIVHFFLIMLLFLVWNNQLREDILILLVLGYIAHLIGDFVTVEGIPLLYPIKSKIGLKLFKTGSGVEGFIGVLLFMLNVYLIYEFSTKFGVSSVAYWENYLQI